MVFTKHLRDGIRRGRIRCSVRIWTRSHVKVGGRYRMDEGQIVVDSIRPIGVADITHDLARESGFSSVKDLLQTARHGSGDNVYLIRFHYLHPGAWDVPVVRPTKSEKRVTVRSKKMDFDVVREIAAALPGVEESTIHGAPSLKVHGRLLACPALHRSAEPGSLAVRIGFDQRADLLAAEPRIYYVTDHYVNYPTVLVRLSQVHRDSLRDLLGMAWRFVSAKAKRSGTRVRRA
jgi:hypothetical protein